MQATKPILKIIIISIAILLASCVVYFLQKEVRSSLKKQSNLEIQILSYDPGLQEIDIRQIEKLKDGQWSSKPADHYNNLYNEQTTWERIHIKNPTNKDKVVVISELGNYTTSQTLYSELNSAPVAIRFGSEHFKQKITLPANTQTTLHIKKTGYQLSLSSTQIYEYETYRLSQLLGLINSTWTYGAIIGIGIFYLASIQSRQTHFSERLAIFSYIAIALAVNLTENNFHSLIELSAPSIKSIGEKIALPLLLVPLSSYLLLRTYNINNNSHPMQQLCIAFSISSLLIAYSLINNHIIPIIYLSFSILSFTHQACWIYYASKSQKLNSIGQTASLAFVLSSTANHILVIAIMVHPELTNARINIINVYYLLCIASAIIMLNDKNIIELLRDKQNKATELRIRNSKAINSEIQRIIGTVDKILIETQQNLKQESNELANSISELRLLHLESKWKRQSIHCSLQQTSNILQSDKTTKQQQLLARIAHPSTRTDRTTKITETATNNKINITDNPTKFTTSTKLTIVIIDDDLATAVLTANLLQALNYQTEIFLNPLHAIEFIEIISQTRNPQRQLHAVISDYEMPEIDGSEALKRIKEILNRDNTASTKLILFSSISKRIKATQDITIIDKTNKRQLIEVINHA